MPHVLFLRRLEVDTGSLIRCRALVVDDPVQQADHGQFNITALVRR
jgi:hypothetical protein